MSYTGSQIKDESAKMNDDANDAAPLSAARKLPGYWTFQVAGWLSFAALSIITLNAWYNPGEIFPALHSIVQSILGIAVSHPLRQVAKRTWNLNIATRLIANGAAILAASQLWTVLRLLAFNWVTGLTIGPEDWGGWIFGSLTVFASWSFCYHALKYYEYWLDARELSITAQNAALAAEAYGQRENVRRLHAENLARQSRLRMLNYQLNPHFFFNSLNSVTALVKRDDKDGAIEMLSRIGDFLRLSLEDVDTLRHPFRDEIDNLMLYLEIEKVRFGERLVTEFNIDDNALDVEIPSHLLQPLIENSIKYAVGRSLSPTTISLQATIRGDRLQIDLSDTGAKEKREHAADIARSPGIGQRNVEERLRSMYGDDFIFETPSGASSGYSIRIVIPTRTETEPSEDPASAPASTKPPKATTAAGPDAACGASSPADG